MNYYKAIIQYQGTGYGGFQWQKDVSSIQNELNQALYRVLKGKVTTVGASRTDAGVHAYTQVVKISSEDHLHSDILRAQLNTFLPATIRCLALDSCDGHFRPVSDSAMKEYRYLFTNNIGVDCRDQLFIANSPYQLNIELMKKCAGMIVGQHDFHNFSSAGSNVKSTTRAVMQSEISIVDPRIVLKDSVFNLPDELTQCYQFRIESEGFLKQMVRHLMSALWFVGREKITPEDFYSFIYSSKKAGQLWRVAPARGLYLYRIDYHQGSV